MHFLAAAPTSASLAPGTVNVCESLPCPALSLCVCVSVPVRVQKGSEGSFIWAAGGNFCGQSKTTRHKNDATAAAAHCLLPSFLFLASSLRAELCPDRRTNENNNGENKCCALKLVSLFTYACVYVCVSECVCNLVLGGAGGSAWWA